MTSLTGGQKGRLWSDHLASEIQAQSEKRSVLPVRGFPCGSAIQNPSVREPSGDAGSIPGSGRSPGGGDGTPLQYPCLENPIDRGAWWPTVHGVAKSQTWLKLVSSSSSWADITDCWGSSLGDSQRFVLLIERLLFFSHCIWLFCDPMDCNPPGSSVHGISQARILEWVDISFSNGSSWPRNQLHICLKNEHDTRQIFHHWATWETWDLRARMFPTTKKNSHALKASFQARPQYLSLSPRRW